MDDLGGDLLGVQEGVDRGGVHAAEGVGAGEVDQDGGAAAVESFGEAGDVEILAEADGLGDVAEFSGNREAVDLDVGGAEGEEEVVTAVGDALGEGGRLIQEPCGLSAVVSECGRDDGG